MHTLSFPFAFECESTIKEWKDKLNS